MSYQAEISRANPSAFLFLLDQSGSMAEPMAGTTSARSKSQFLADAVNSWLKNLSLRCARPEGVRSYFEISIIGYGAAVNSGLTGRFAGREFVPLGELAANPARVEERTKKVEDGAGGLADQVVKMPVWVDAVSDGGTPMCAALTTAAEYLGRWVEAHKGAYPPTLIHITDGESTDGDPRAAAARVTGLSTSDGELGLFSLHVSSSPHSTPILLPSSDAGLPDAFAKLLYEVSSPLTEIRIQAAVREGIPAQTGARSYGYNVEAVELLRLLDIGTKTPALR